MRSKLVALGIAMAVSVGLLAPAAASAAPAAPTAVTTAVSDVQAPLSVTAPSAATTTPDIIDAPEAMAAVTSTTKSCGTGGYSYQTDSMYVVRSQYSSTTWKYVVTRTPNRTAYDSHGHSYRHTAAYLHTYFSSSYMTTKTYPANSTTVYSGSAGVDFKLVVSVVVDGGLHAYYMSCSVSF